jgi:hypothetical protein
LSGLGDAVEERRNTSIRDDGVWLRHQKDVEQREDQETDLIAAAW